MRRPFALLLSLALTGCHPYWVPGASLPGTAPGIGVITSPLAAHPVAAQALAVATHAAPLHAFTSDATGFDTHSFWYDTGREVIVFDAQFTPAYAQQLIASIRAATRSPITTLVITHPNPDKFNGAPAFQAIGAKVVASRATAAALPGVHAYKKAYFVNVAKTFTDATYPAQATVDVTFEHALTLPGGVVLRTLAHAGVASTQTVAYIPAANALVVGDLVHARAHAWLEGGIVNGRPQLELGAWAAALDELKNYRGATVYGGRGEAAPVAAAVADEQAYLRQVAAIADAFLASQPDPQAVASGPDAAKLQDALADRIDAAFPAYALPYMTHYSVYGLVNARLAAGSFKIR